MDSGVQIVIHRVSKENSDGWQQYGEGGCGSPANGVLEPAGALARNFQFSKKQNSNQNEKKSRRDGTIPSG